MGSRPVLPRQPQPARSGLGRGWRSGQKNHQVGPRMKNAAEEASASRDLAWKKTGIHSRMCRSRSDPRQGFPLPQGTGIGQDTGGPERGVSRGLMRLGHHLRQLSVAILGEEGGPWEEEALSLRPVCAGEREAMSSLGDEGSCSPHPAVRGHRGLGGGRVTAGGGGGGSLRCTGGSP